MDGELYDRMKAVLEEQLEDAKGDLRAAEGRVDAFTDALGALEEERTRP